MNLNELVRDWFDIIKDTPFDNLHWYIDFDGDLPVIRSMNIGNNWWDNVYCCYDKAYNEFNDILNILFEKYKYYIEMYEDKQLNNGVEYMILRVRFSNIPVVYRCGAMNKNNRRCKNRISMSNFCRVHEEN